MDKVGVILIVLFLLIIILGPMYATRVKSMGKSRLTSISRFCATITRASNKPAKVFNPQADDLGKAREQLVSVTTCSSAGKRAKASGNVDVEASVSQAELGEW